MRLGVKKKVLQVGLLVLVTAAVFANTLSIDFLWDDGGLVKANQYIRTCKNIPLFFTPFYSQALHLIRGQYRPIRTASLAIDYRLWGLDPAGYHLTNLWLHIVNVLLVYFLVTVIKKENGDYGRQSSLQGNPFFGLPFFTALLFALHPIHTESVNLIKNRSDLLALLFSLSALLFFIYRFSMTSRLSRFLFSLGAWFCFIVAVLSKETALILPGLMVLYAVCFLDRPRQKGVPAMLVPYVMIILVYGWFRYLYISDTEPKLVVYAIPATAGQHLLAVIKTIGIYLKMLMIPYPLDADYLFKLPSSVWEPQILLLIISLLLIGILTVVAFRRDKIVFFAIGWMVLTLLPAANIIYLGSRPIAEQRLYFPSLGFCLLLGYAFERLCIPTSGRRTLRASIIIGLLMAITVSLYAAVTVRRNSDWGDAVVFYTRNIALNPYSSRMHNNLAVAFSGKGDFKDALRHYKIALRLKPDNMDALFNMGLLLSETGRLEEAVTYYQKLLRLQPFHVKAHNNLGFTYERIGRLEDAFRHLQLAIQIDPYNEKSYLNLGFLMMDMGRFKEAAGYFLIVLKLDPGNEEARRQYEYCSNMLTSRSGAIKSSGSQ